ncbi:CRISPR-associated endonuclease Cas2 [Brumimicrobium aurantiacum]|uniref:CRISPR-associated endoribonuclease Cas2 n=1 Tax=Brumimicrobium aurantiacum TaxID=1737063 RepID=A0A3E1EYL8_9FLAO|nr:CRISPR-associated endonuclease Cas2 [Brumimicrobium aurantiacum]RFC54638.1 CRISPR-associated endonuclease Cas2 [Brumimicrobium aurantiacum]
MNNVIIVTYDISNNKVRTQFSKFLEKYGVRVQFSVFEIKNSKRIMDIVKNGIEERFSKKFEKSDSIYIFCANHKNTIRYGSANLLDNDMIFI